MQNFSIREVRSQFRGRCFTLSSARVFFSREYATVSIRAPDGDDNQEPPEVYIFVHEPGQEFYVVAENFPFDVETETVGEGSDCIIEKKVTRFQIDILHTHLSRHPSSGSGVDLSSSCPG